MKISKRTKKGFTLIELIIVLAIFSIILMLVMSFIDPVSKIMTSTSTKERTASYVDNIGEYVDKSLRHAKFVRIYEGEYSDIHASTYTKLASEDDAIKSFVDDYFDGALGDDNNALKGKVHVLRFYNDNMPGVDDKPGVVYESIYSFVAGDSCPVSYDFETGDEDDPTETKTGRVFEGEDTTLYYGSAEKKITCPSGSFPRSVVTKETYSDGLSDHQVINPEHFRDYSYFYKIGYCVLDPIKPSELSAYTDASGDELPTDSKYYYSRISQMKENDGVSKMTIGADSFSLNVISYQNNSKGKNMIDALFTDGEPAVTSPVPVFKSPAYLNSTSMTLKNCIASGLMDSTLYEKYMRVAQTTNTGVVKKDSEGKTLLEAIDPREYYSTTFKYVPADSSVTSTNLYIIFALPEDVSPSKIVYN